MVHGVQICRLLAGHDSAEMKSVFVESAAAQFLGLCVIVRDVNHESWRHFLTGACEVSNAMLESVICCRQDLKTNNSLV